MRHLGAWLAGAVLVAAQPVLAKDDTYVENNLIAILFHELGHALIDIMGLPVFGQEEDAADVASILLIDMMFDEDSAVGIAYDAAFGFLGDAQALQESGEEPAWRDVHGPDLQRYYTLVCLFAGGDPDARRDIAQELGYPKSGLQPAKKSVRWLTTAGERCSMNWPQTHPATA